MSSLSRPLLFALYGSTAALIVALILGELVWWTARPAEAPPAEPHTAPPRTAPPEVRLAITASPKVSLYPGTANTVAVRVARDRLDGPVAVRFTSLNAELSVAEIIVPTEEAGATAQIVAAPGAKRGTHQLTAIATSTADRKERIATVTVEVVVLAPPPPGPRLAVTVSPRIQAYQRGTNTFAVRVARGEFDGPVTVAFGNLPEGVTIAPVTISSGATDGTATVHVEGGAATGLRKVAVTASANPNGVAISAQTDAPIDVLLTARAPVDVVFALDCTGSMRRYAGTLGESLPAFALELGKKTDTRFGLVGFQDTTLGQPLKVPRLDGEGFTNQAATLRIAMRDLRFGGGGGEGDSSMDGIAEAAEYPFRAGAVRVIALVTDGGPKRIDGRIKSAEELVKHLKAKKIDQFHIVALPDERKAFEPLWEGAKGKYFELKDAGKLDATMTDIGNTIAVGVPEPVVGKVEPGGAARAPVLPPPGEVRLPAVPAGAEPDEPKVEKPTPLPPERKAEEPTPEEPPSKAGALTVWASVVVLFGCGALALGQLFVLPGPRPAVAPAAVGYGGGLLAGLLAGAVGYVALDATGVPLLARLAGAVAFGAVLGVAVPLAERAFAEKDEEDEPDEPKDRSRTKAKPPAEEVLELDEAELAQKPKIAPPKPRDGCPGCGRAIPGTTGERYCMLCDKTF